MGDLVVEIPIGGLSGSFTERLTICTLSDSTPTQNTAPFLTKVALKNKMNKLFLSITLKCHFVFRCRLYLEEWYASRKYWDAGTKSENVWSSTRVYHDRQLSPKWPADGQRCIILDTTPARNTRK